MIEKLYTSFNPNDSWAGSEKLEAPLHLKVFIDFSADNFAFLAGFENDWFEFAFVELFTIARKVLFVLDLCEGCEDFVELYPWHQT